MSSDKPDWFAEQPQSPPSSGTRLQSPSDTGYAFAAQGKAEELGEIPLPSPWIRVTGARVPQDVEIVVGWTNHELSLLAIRVDGRGTQPPEPITARALRELRIGEMMLALSDRLSNTDPSVADLEIGSFSDFEPALEDWRVQGGNLESALAANTHVPLERAKQGRPPSTEQLRAFVGVYASQLRGGRRNAMTKTARDLHMARSTGYRWLEHAREAGLLDGLEADDE